jgi:NADH-ubiquinone oxidoreductase chain 3
MFIISWLTIPLIILILVSLNFFLRQKNSLNSKLSIYECGFSPKFSARLPFSLRFFLLALLFLIFDVELTLVIIFPLIYLNTSFILSIVIFCTFLFLGLLHEWNEGSLSWLK